MIQCRIIYEALASWTFQVGVSGGSSVADALQVVMPEGRTPRRHNGRYAEVRRFSPLSLRRHPSSRTRRFLFVLAFSLFTFSLSDAAHYCPTSPHYPRLSAFASPLRKKGQENQHPHSYDSLAISLPSAHFSPFRLSSLHHFAIFLSSVTNSSRQHNLCQ